MQKFYIHGFRKNRELFLIKYIIKYRTKFVNGKCVGWGKYLAKKKACNTPFFICMHYGRCTVSVFSCSFSPDL